MQFITHSQRLTHLDLSGTQLTEKMMLELLRAISKSYTL